jgi:hypothetical protein
VCAAPAGPDCLVQKPQAVRLKPAPSLANDWRLTCVFITAADPCTIGLPSQSEGSVCWCAGLSLATVCCAKSTVANNFDGCLNHSAHALVHMNYDMQIRFGVVQV